MKELNILMPQGLITLGQGVSVAPDLATFKPVQKVSLYADPLSWLILEAVEQAIGEHLDAILSASPSVGHIAISDHCTLHTMRAIAKTIPSGHISPLRFSGACPGMICSLPSQFLKFSGPSIVFSMPPESALPYAAVLARAWLHEHLATHVIITVHAMDASGHRIISTVVTDNSREMPQ
ncbi:MULTISPECIES: coronafacic acid synthetase [unclassified Brenneria]|uniref:coronafacic acid synthetase n=1 Tax=unclassified Brenneria TaxID=2634434 RepID=UPI0018F0CD6E|nr:coronafacic acid synthetase [Brenneria sp. L3-3C-1]MBJ7221974.1 coronafacic acid synthetase [Brenneria sp. L3-3C-1]MEE3643216.1 coronafacic acid synthetase [Brenneria sp. L3_3C_1]